MSNNISYSKVYFDISADKAKKATGYMSNAVSNSASAIGSIPSDFVDSSNASNSINNIKNICIIGPDIDSTFFDLGVLLENMEGDTSGTFTFDFGDGLYYINWNEDCYVNVTPGAEADFDGVKYGIDKYVLGVLDGEAEVRKWGRMVYDGEISKEEFYTCCKAFSVMARSYGIAQTEFNTRFGHDKDKKISGNGGSKQCFNTRLYDYSDPNNDFQKGWSLYSGMAASAVIETTGMVIANDKQPISTYYNNDQGQTKKILEYALEGYDYISILKKLYPDNYIDEGCDLKYFDYKNKTILGNVPKDTEISELIGLNLTNEKPDSDNTKWTYQLTDSGRSVGVANKATNNGETYISEVKYNDSTLSQATRVFISSSDSTSKIEAVAAATVAANVDDKKVFTDAKVEAKLGAAIDSKETSKSTPSIDEVETKEDLEYKNILSENKEGVLNKDVSEKIDDIKDKIKTTTETTKTDETKTEEVDYGLNVETDKGKSSTNDTSVEKETTYNPPSSHSDSTPAPVTPAASTYILPENKFSDMLPNITSGNLDSMEISTVHASYDISGINDEVYNNYLNSLKEAGYTLGNDGITWVKDNYTLNLIRNNTDLNIYFKVN
jgi:hypothetical protein